MGSPPGRAISRSFGRAGCSTRLRLRDRDRVPESGLVVGTHLAGRRPTATAGPSAPSRRAYRLTRCERVPFPDLREFRQYLDPHPVSHRRASATAVRLPQDLARGGHPRGVVRIHLFVWFRVSRHHPLDLCVVCGFLPVRLGFNPGGHVHKRSPARLSADNRSNGVVRNGVVHAPILAVLVCMALAVYGFKVSLGGRPAFKDLLAET